MFYCVLERAYVMMEREFEVLLLIRKIHGGERVYIDLGYPCAYVEVRT